MKIKEAKERMVYIEKRMGLHRMAINLNRRKLREWNKELGKMIRIIQKLPPKRS